MATPESVESIEHSSSQETMTGKNIDKITWGIIDTFFKDNPQFLTSHHINSYNQFIDESIPKIFRDNNPLILTEENDMYKLELYLGGKDNKKIYYGKPMIYDTSHEGDRFHYMYPNEARLRNMTYGFSIHYDVDVDISIKDSKTNKYSTEEIKLTNIFLGRFPIMLHSKLCILSAIAREARHALGECRNDAGGYFIIDGKEKVIVCQERFADNMIYVRNKVTDDTYSHSADVRTIAEDPSKPKRTLSIRIVAPTNSHSGGQIVVLVPNVRLHVPLFILMRALGLTTDREIIEACLLDTDKYAGLIDEFIPSIHDAGLIYTQLQAMEYIALLTKQKSVESVMEILMNYLCPNIGAQNFHMKALYIGYIVRKLLMVYKEIEPPTDRDNFRFKRVDLSGKMLADLFMEYYGAQLKNIRLKMDREYNYNKEEYAGENFKNILKKQDRIFEDRIVEDGMRRGMKGDWGSTAYTKIEGASQPLNRLSFYSAISHLRKINLDIDETAKVVPPRMLHPSQWGIICPAETPDGGSIGLHKHMAISTYITAGQPRKQMIEWIKQYDEDFGYKRLDEMTYKELDDTTKLFVNGVWIANIESPLVLISEFRTQRRSGYIPIHNSIHWDIARNEIYIFTDGGRLCRPVYHIDFVDYGTMNFKMPRLNINKYSNKMSWKSLVVGSGEYNIDKFLPVSGTVNTGIIEYLDTMESEGALIAMYYKDLKKYHTHCEIHPSLALGVMGNFVIYPENNPAPRDLYGCGQSKQGVSLYHSNFLNRIDHMGVLLNYGQIPIVRSRYMKYIDREQHPYGENVMVAIMCYNGHNTEDAILINEAAVQRGLFRTTYYSSYEAAEEKTKYSNRVFGKIDGRVQGLRPNYDYSLLDNEGIVKEGTVLHDKVVLIGQITKSKDELLDASEVPKKGQVGIVDRVFIAEGDEGTRIAKVRVREDRLPEMGDKFSSRCGQKGTIGLVVPEADMPFTASGLRPDIIVNPHALPTRMTIGQLIEMMLGLLCVQTGASGDATAFTNHGDKTKEIGELLVANGMNKSGNEILYDGYRGNQMDADIFFGISYYMRLKHMVKDKINYRARGPRTLLTRQTVQGRANDGGGRLGEMERDCVLSHGMSAFMDDTLMNRGDEYYMVICNQTGQIAIYNEERNLFISPAIDKLEFKMDEIGNIELRNISKFGRTFSVVRVPYAFKLLLQELLTMNVQMRIITEDTIDQLPYLSGVGDQFKINMDNKPVDDLTREITRLKVGNANTVYDIEEHDDHIYVNSIFEIPYANDKPIKNTETTYKINTELYEEVRNIPHIPYNQAIQAALSYMYNAISAGLYVSFRGGRLDKAIAFKNMNYENHANLTEEFFLKNHPFIRTFAEYKALQTQYTKYIPKIKDEKWLPLDYWGINGPLIGNMKGIKGGPHTEQIVRMLEKLDDVMDTDIIINMRDWPVLNDNKHPISRTHYSQGLPILNFCMHNELSVFKHTLIPTPDEAELMDTNIQVKPWEERKNKAIFRGSATGSGVNRNTNMRIRFVEDVDGNINYPNIDAGLTSWAVRDRIHPTDPNAYMDFIRPNIPDLAEYRTTTISILKDQIKMDEQMDNKYAIYIEGNVAAYRLLGLMLRGFCVLYVESPYEMLVNKFAKAGEHYILINRDLSNLKEVHDSFGSEEHRIIAENGRKLALELIQNKYIDYLRSLFNTFSTMTEYPEPINVVGDTVKFAYDVPEINDTVQMDKVKAGIPSTKYEVPTISSKYKKELKYTNDGLIFMTPYSSNMKLFKILSKYGAPNRVIDATGGLGMDTIAYAINGYKVITYEIDATRYYCLEHNVEVYKSQYPDMDVLLNKSNALNAEVLEGDWVHIDVPWGGINYKANKVINELYMYADDGTQVKLTEFVAELRKKAKLIILKLPQNFNENVFNPQTTRMIDKLKYVIIDTEIVAQGKSGKISEIYKEGKWYMKKWFGDARSDHSLDREVGALRLMERLELGHFAIPLTEVHEDKNYIIIPKLGDTLWKYGNTTLNYSSPKNTSMWAKIVYQVLKFALQLQRNEIQHGDIHPLNLVENIDRIYKPVADEYLQMPEFIFIDFGMSTYPNKAGNNPELEAKNLVNYRDIVYFIHRLYTWPLRLAAEEKGAYGEGQEFKHEGWKAAEWEKYETELQDIIKSKRLKSPVPQQIMDIFENVIRAMGDEATKYQMSYGIPDEVGKAVHDNIETILGNLKDLI
jgi:DNA-directed RNA polymerase II subunit RPB2